MSDEEPPIPEEVLTSAKDQLDDEEISLADNEENLHATVDLDAGQFGEVFDDVEERRFEQTQTEYKEWVVDRLQQHHTTTVTYTGDNNVTYNKTCEPNRSDIPVQSIEPVYLPEVRHTTDIQEYTFPYEYYAAAPSTRLAAGVRRGIRPARLRTMFITMPLGPQGNSMFDRI